MTSAKKTIPPPVFPASPVVQKQTTPKSQPLTINPLRAASPRPVAPSLRSRIDTFLASYTNAYELLNIDTFATFFTDDAKENNTPFKEKFFQYRKLFAGLKEISYKVTPRSWHSYNNLIYLSGRFHAYLLYTNGEEVNIHGATSFLLSEDQEHHLKVKKLTYTFD